MIARLLFILKNEGVILISIHSGRNTSDIKKGVHSAPFYFSTTATASISQRTPLGKSFTATQLRAGLERKYLA